MLPAVHHNCITREEMSIKLEELRSTQRKEKRAGQYFEAATRRLLYKIATSWHSQSVTTYVLMQWLVPLVRDSFFHHHLVTIITHVYIPYHTYSSTIRTLITSYTYSSHNMCVLYRLLYADNTLLELSVWGLAVVMMMDAMQPVLQMLGMSQTYLGGSPSVCGSMTIQRYKCWRGVLKTFVDPGVWGVGRGSNTPRPHGKQQHITIWIIMLA